MVRRSGRVASPRKRREKKERQGLGYIRADEAYTLEEVKSRLDLTDSAWWALLQEGFPQKQLGKRKFILGKAIIAYLENLPDVQPAQDQGSLESV